MASQIERLRAEIRSTLNASSAGWRAKVLRFAAWLTAPQTPRVEFIRIEDVLPPEELAEHKARHERELAEVISKLIARGDFDEALRARHPQPQLAAE